jgi:hypothetical protein
VVHKPKERLLLSSLVTVECPGEDPLGSHHESQIGIHAAPAWRSVISTAARSELVDPDRCRQCSLGHQRAQ